MGIGSRIDAVDLGANMLPADSDGVTIEVWATQRGVPRPFPAPGQPHRGLQEAGRHSRCRNGPWP